MLNIPSYIDDPSYRYKMPRLITKVEGKGNGIKTNLVNLIEAAKALRVPVQYPLKFLGAELGAQTDLKEKYNSFIVNGKHDTGTVQKLMDKFVEKYILCPKCKLPETTIIVKKNTIYGNCKACGRTKPLDNAHRVSNYIVKNPPKDKSEFGNTKADQLEHKTKKLKQKAGEEEKSPSTKKKKKKAKEGADEAEQTLTELTTQSPEILDTISRVQEIKETEDSWKELKREIRRYQVAQDFNHDLKHYVAVHGLFTAESLLSSWSKYAPIFKSYIKVEGLEGKKHLFFAFQCFMFETYPDIQKYFPTMMHKLYEEALLDETFFMEWYANVWTFDPSNSMFDQQVDLQCRESMKEMLEWLKNAESGGESSEDEGEKEEEEEGEEEKEEVKKQKELIVQELEKQKKEIVVVEEEKGEREKAESDVLKIVVDQADIDIDDI